MATKEDVISIIKTCFDPEIPVNVYDLGLVYNVDVKGDACDITMTLTSQGCPSAQQIPDLIRYRVQSEAGLKDVNVKVVWDPAWNPSMISPEGKKALRLDDEF